MKAIKLTFLALVSAALLAQTSEATIVRVQSKSANTGASNAATLPITLDATPTAGSIIVVTASVAAGSAVSTRMTEQTGITWLGYVRTSTNTQLFAVGRVFSTIASATITVATPASQPISAVAVEYSGVNIRVDKQVTAAATSTSPASGATETTNSANELWVGAITSRSTSANTFSSPTNSFSIVAQTNTTNGSTNTDTSAAFLERIVTSAGTPNAGATSSANQPWIAQVLTFEETTASGSTTIPSIGN